MFVPTHACAVMCVRPVKRRPTGNSYDVGLRTTVQALRRLGESQSAGLAASFYFSLPVTMSRKTDLVC